MAQKTLLQLRSAMLTEQLTKQLESKDAAERTQAAASLTAIHVAETDADSRNRTSDNDAKGREDKIGPLRLEIKTLSKQVADTEASLIAMTAERDTLAAKIAELQPLADRLPVVDQELAALKSSFDARVAEMRAELVAEATAKLSKAEAAQRAASEMLKENERRFSAAGGAEFMERLTKLVEAHDIQLDFWSESPTLSPSYYELFGWTPTKAKLWTGLRFSWQTDTEGFRQAALKAFIDAQPTYPGEGRREIPDDAGLKKDFFIEATKRFEVYDEIWTQAEYAHSIRKGRSDKQMANIRANNEEEQIRQTQLIQEINRREYEDKTSTLRIDQRNSLAPLDRVQEW
jgi:hypothetical protein